MTREERFDALMRLIGPQMEEIIFLVGAPRKYLSSSNVPQVQRAIELLEWVESTAQLPQLDKLLQKLLSSPRSEGTHQLHVPEHPRSTLSVETDNFLSTTESKVAFVGSTSSLASHREAVIRAIGTLGEWRSIEVKREGRWANHLKDQVALSDVVIIMLGDEYESVIDLEYQAAVAKKKPVFVFLKQLPEEPRIDMPYQSTEFQDLRLQLLSSVIIDVFNTAEDLSRRVTAALRNWRLRSPLSSSLPPQPRIQHPYSLDRHFVGRDAERVELTRWFDKSNKNVCVIETLGGVGKTALAWVWVMFDILGTPLPEFVERRAGRNASGSAVDGVLWWSFYELNSRFPEFLDVVEDYARGDDEMNQLDKRRDRVERLIELLASRKFLLVLDGFERELMSYRQGYGSNDGDIPPIGDHRESRRCIDPEAARFLRAVASRPGLQSRILLTTRLFPTELEDRSGDALPGCWRLVLGDLSQVEVLALFQSCGVRANPTDTKTLAQKYGAHALAMRLLLGVIIGDPLDKGDLRAVEGYDPIPELINRRHHILEVAYDSLSRSDQQLLSGIAAYRGPVDDAGIVVVEQSQSMRAGRVARDRNSLKQPLRSLLSRNLLLREHRRGVFDMHPIVRKYAYDRLVNKAATHLALANYFQSFASEVPIASRRDLDPLIELVHQQVAAGLTFDALQILRERLYDPLVEQFADIRTALEVFTRLAPNTPLERQLIQSNDSTLWFNRLRAGILRRSGLFASTIDWLLRSEASEGAVLYCNIRTIVEDFTEREMEAIKVLRASGRLSEALARGQLFGTDRFARSGLTLAQTAEVDAERALTLGTIGRFAEADDLVASCTEVPAFPVVIQARVCRIRSILALWRGQISSAIELAMEGWDRLAQGNQWNLDTMEETIRSLIQTATCVSAISDVPILTHDEACLERLAILDTRLGGTLRTCRELGLVEVEMGVQLALGRIRLALRDIAGSAAQADFAASLAERCGHRLHLADALILMAEVAAQDNDEERVLKFISEAEVTATCEGGERCYFPGMKAITVLRARFPPSNRVREVLT